MVERPLTNIFYRYGKIISNRPLPFLICAFLLALFLALGCLWRFEILEDKISLYTLENSAAAKSRSVLDALFPINDSNPYYFERRYAFERAGFLVLNARSEIDILGSQALTEASEIWHQIESREIEFDGSKLSYKSMCIQVPYVRSCVESPILFLYDMFPLAIKMLKYPEDPLTTIFTGELIGNPQLKNGTVTSAQILMVPYMLHHSSEISDEKAKMWERNMEQFLETLKPKCFEVFWWTSETLGIETRKDTAILLKLLVPLFIVVTTFTLLCCLVNDCVRSKPFLGLGGVCSACCAILSSIGLMAYFGQGLTTLTYFMPFIIFSIAVDNIFLFLSSWHKTSTLLPVSERTSLVLKDVGVSITVTSLTDFLSFAVGCFTGFPAVQNFCAYSAVAICFVYIYQLTFFTAVMVLTGIREAKGRHCLMCSVTIISRIHEQRQLMDTEPAPQRPNISSAIKPHMLSKFFRTTYADFITNRSTQILILLLFSAYLGGAIWGCTRINIGLEPMDLLPKFSQARNALNLKNEYLSRYSGIAHVVFTNLSRDLDYSTDYWSVLTNELSRFEHTPFTGVADSWIRAYLTFTLATGIRLSPDNFVLNLRQRFFKQDKFARYKLDVIFDEKGEKISATRFPLRLENIGYSNQSEAMQLLRKISVTSQLNATAFADFFNFADQYISILPMTLTNIGIATSAVVLVSLFLIPQPLCSLWVCLSVLSINVGIIGYMSFWGVKLDLVSMVTIIMSIGFCVDFSAHIAYHFSKGENGSASDRVRSALYSVGFPIVQSGLSTVIGISFLTIVDNYVYLSFVKTISLVILLGIFHGLMVLPVVLTLSHSQNAEKRNFAVSKLQLPHMDAISNGTELIQNGFHTEGIFNGHTARIPAHSCQDVRTNFVGAMDFNKEAFSTL